MHHADRNVRAGSDALQRIAGSTGGSAKFNSTRSDNMAAKKGRKAAKKGGRKAAKKGGRKAAKKGGRKAAKKGGRR
jgi:colicin import membrane protein